MLYCAAISTRIYQALYKSITSPSQILLKKGNTIQTDNYKLSAAKKMAVRTNLFSCTAYSPPIIPCLL